MQAAVRSARRPLGDAAGRVVALVRGRLHPAGGFRGRADAPDLYYTVFGAETARGLGEPLPPNLPNYLETFGSGAGLDFVHLACLARLWADVADAGPPGFAPAKRGSALAKPGRAGPPPEVRDAVRGRLASFRAADGGFSHVPGAARGTAYGGFLGFMAYEDLSADLPDPAGLVRSVGRLRAAGGGYANEPGRPAPPGRSPEGLTPATAAALALLAHLGRPVDGEAVRWLLARLHGRGGFVAGPNIPVPDLLSTATALYALRRAGAPLDAVRRPCLGFLDSVWSEADGGFRAHAFDDTVDCEYTWYGLLALGCLEGQAMPTED